MQPIRFDALLHPEPWFQDHTFAGQAVLPAVESMAFLAKLMQKHCPTMDFTAMHEAEFPRFLVLADKHSPIECVVEFEERGQQVHVTLYTRKYTPKFSRLIRHAALFFGAGTILPPVEELTTSKQDTFSLSAEIIYSKLVPFGLAYRNLLSLEIVPEGCIAQLHTPILPVAAPAIGSPFLLDSAMHGACIWGQYFAGFVPFPVAFRQRQILIPARENCQYQAMIIPVSRQEKELHFDMDITDMLGNTVEQIRGLVMRDVSGGTILPPDWLREQ